jgi:hypothetical protein
MKKIIKHYQMTGRLIVAQGYLLQYDIYFINKSNQIFIKPKIRGP